MKIFYIYFFHLLTISLWSQNSVIVNYQSYQKTTQFNSISEVTLLVYENKAKLVLGKPKLLNTNYKADVTDDNKIFFVEKPSVSNINWFVDVEGSKIIKSIYTNAKHSIVTDQLPAYHWEITNELDSIAQYQVVKATTYFRGRSFIAWFAPSIPISYGPWKLNGLPGLILKMYDEDQYFIWKVNSINLNANLSSSDFEISKTDYDIQLTYQEAIKGYEEEQHEKAKRTNTKLMERGGRFEHVVNSDSKLEKIYEWEEGE